MAYKKTLTKEERQQKQDEYEREVADLFIKAIKENKAPWTKPWEPGVNVLDYNMFNMTKGGKQNNHYKGINGLICELNRSFFLHSDDPRWCTVANLMEHNKSIEDTRETLWIKKGEKGTTIRFFEKKYFDENGKQIHFDDEHPEDRNKEVAFTKTVLKPWVIFNASQIGKYTYDEHGEKVKDENGNFVYRPAFEPIEIDKNDKNRFKPIIEPETLVRNTGAEVMHDQIDQCFYTESDDRIHLVNPEKFESAEAYYATLLHELTHWTGVEERLNREEFKKYNSSKEWRAKEELVAQIASYQLCKDLNLKFIPDQRDISYVDSWCSFIKDKPQGIFEACQKAKKASDFIQDFSNKNTKKEVLTNEVNIEIEVTKKKAKSR